MSTLTQARPIYGAMSMLTQAQPMVKLLAHKDIHRAQAVCNANYVMMRTKQLNKYRSSKEHANY